MNELPKHIVSDIQRIFAKFPAIEKAILYGSRAKGNAKNGSDIDLTIVGNSLLFSDLLKIESELSELNSPYLIDLCIYHQIQNPDLLGHIQRVGKLFYEK